MKTNSPANRNEVDIKFKERIPRKHERAGGQRLIKNQWEAGRHYDLNMQPPPSHRLFEKLIKTCIDFNVADFRSFKFLIFIQVFTSQFKRSV